ncbi:hypothetical protein AVEN_249435-1 [Araneus ventricosus]|uniref:Uncharacterized protein n=1 Tax=Araneus ventricosus TaxID=182803 RepID=A0A4Y2RF15_ARAVE|nr:hypothetical protein AVEN_249435-1 [Araneus ventricosus]
MKEMAGYPNCSERFMEFSLKVMSRQPQERMSTTKLILVIMHLPIKESTKSHRPKEALLAKNFAKCSMKVLSSHPKVPGLACNKKDGSWRFCDCNRNNVMKKDVYPPHRLDDTLDCL